MLFLFLVRANIKITMFVFYKTYINVHKDKTISADIRGVGHFEDELIVDKECSIYALLFFNQDSNQIVLFSTLSGNDFYIFSKAFIEMKEYFLKTGIPKTFMTPSMSTYGFLNSSLYKYSKKVNIYLQDYMKVLDDIFDDAISKMNIKNGTIDA